MSFKSYFKSNLLGFLSLAFPLAVFSLYIIFVLIIILSEGGVLPGDAERTEMTIGIFSLIILLPATLLAALLGLIVAIVDLIRNSGKIINISALALNLAIIVFFGSYLIR